MEAPVEQDKQELSQFLQAKPSKYFPNGQVSMQLKPSNNLIAGQVTQFVEDEKHVKQVGLHD